MRVLVTGASGFVGRNLVPQLSANPKIEVTASDTVSSASDPNVSFLDVTDDAATSKALRGIDVVVHLATHQLVPSLSDPRQNAKVNIIGMLNILEGARVANVRKVIFTSASSIVGEVSYNPVDEKHPCEPRTPYGVSKLACEHYLKTYQRLFGLDYVIFRVFNIYGPHQRDGVIPSIYHKINNDLEVDIYGDGGQMRDFVFIGDIGEIFAEAIVGEIKNLTVNIGTGKGVTILDLAKLAWKIIGKDPKLKFHPPRPGEIQNFVADTRLLKSAFGITPQTDIEEGLHRTFDWLAKAS